MAASQGMRVSGLSIRIGGQCGQRASVCWVPGSLGSRTQPCPDEMGGIMALSPSQPSHTLAPDGCSSQEIDFWTTSFKKKIYLKGFCNFGFSHRTSEVSFTIRIIESLIERRDWLNILFMLLLARTATNSNQKFQDGSFPSVKL